jgi:hypothetical protein
MADKSTRPAAWIRYAGRVLLIAVVAYFAWETFKVYETLVGDEDRPKIADRVDVNSATDEPTEVATHLLNSLDLVSGGWQFAELPWYVQVRPDTASDSSPPIDTTPPPNRAPTNRPPTELDSLVLEMLSLLSVQASPWGEFTRRYVRNGNTELVVYSSRRDVAEKSEVIESVLGRLAWGSDQILNVTLHYQEQEKQAARSLLPLPEFAELLATRSSGGRMCIGELVEIDGDFDRLVAFWRSAGYAVRRLTERNQPADVLHVEKSGEFFCVQPLGVLRGAKSAVLIVRTSLPD